MTDRLHTPTFLDADTIRAALPPAQAVAAITRALTEGYDPASDIPRSSADTSHGHFLLMPSEVGGFAGVKVATVAPDNPAAGRPRIQASYLLFDAPTLSLVALLDGTALTGVRTAAVSIAAVLPVLRSRFEDPLRVVVFGAGPQAIAHVETLAALTALTPEPLASVAFVVRRPQGAASGARALGEVLPVGSARAREALAAAHVVVCATTARTPLFPADAVSPTAVVIAVGSHEPEARELDAALLTRSGVIVEDVATALREAGDIILAEREGALRRADLIPMRDAVTGAAAISSRGPVVFKSVGMSWQDLVIARAVHGRVSRWPGRG